MKESLNNRASLTLGLGLEACRKAAFLSRLELANRIGCSPQHITRIEEQQTNPAQALIADLATALGRTPSDLYLTGELQLDERALKAARRKRRRIEEERDLTAILEALRDLRRGDLRTIAEAVAHLSE